MGGGTATEAVASRENRDIELRGGDVHYTQGVGLNGATASLVTAKSAGGRTYRDYLQRVDDRNNRIYVDATTGISALSGAKDALFDELKAETGLYPF